MSNIVLVNFISGLEVSVDVNNKAIKTTDTPGLSPEIFKLVNIKTQEIIDLNVNSGALVTTAG